MFDEDADSSKERSERGRKNIQYIDFYESVKMDIKNEADCGNNRTRYSISEKTSEFVESAVEHLEMEGYKVKFEKGTRSFLEISW